MTPIPLHITSKDKNPKLNAIIKHYLALSEKSIKGLAGMTNINLKRLERIIKRKQAPTPDEVRELAKNMSFPAALLTVPEYTSPILLDMLRDAVKEHHRKQESGEYWQTFGQPRLKPVQRTRMMKPGSNMRDGTIKN